MRLLRHPRSSRAGRRSGFTLAEVAVTIVIVGIGLVLVMQGMNTAQFTAAHTRNLKLARDLGLYTLGQVEAGLYWEAMELEDFGPYSYADQGYPDFAFEISVGDDGFRPIDPDAPFDSWAPDEDEEDEDEDEEVREPFEKVSVRVTFPPLLDFPTELVVEKYIPWDQVYGVDEDEAEGDGSSSPGSGGSSAGDLR